LPLTHDCHRAASGSPTGDRLPQAATLTARPRRTVRNTTRTHSAIAACARPQCPPSPRRPPLPARPPARRPPFLYSSAHIASNQVNAPDPSHPPVLAIVSMALRVAGNQPCAVAPLHPACLRRLPSAVVLSTSVALPCRKRPCAHRIYKGRRGAAPDAQRLQPPSEGSIDRLGSPRRCANTTAAPPAPARHCARMDRNTRKKRSPRCFI